MESGERLKPESYGTWWNTNGAGLDWYQMIYGFRKQVHDYFTEWVNARQDIQSVLEIGCGRAYPYSNIFAEYRYTGCDISQKEIDACHQYENPLHSYFCIDFLGETSLPEKYDLVFSHAVIDHVYDISLFLKRAAAASRKYIFLTAYRGWFPELDYHNYEWDESATCYQNRVSPREAAAILKSKGCVEVRVLPLECNNVHDAISHETAIIAQW